MSHTVIWRPRAKTQLAEAYLLGRSLGIPRAVTQAAAQIDTLLKATPEVSGEGRRGTLRVLIIDPLIVDFEIRASDNTVIVHALRFSVHRFR